MQKLQEKKPLTTFYPPLSTRGFTLVELLVVIVLFSVMAGVVGVNVNKARLHARDGQRVTDIGIIQNALNRYFVDNKIYPASLNSLVPAVLPALPTDPKTGNNYVYAGVAPSGTACNSYHLGAIMEDAGGSSLSQDMDRGAGTACGGSAADFHGNAASCLGGSIATPDPCFDMVPQ